VTLTRVLAGELAWTAETNEGSMSMPDPQNPTDTHPDFDKMCAEVEDFELMPTVTTNPAAPAQDLTEEERTAPLDEVILAGLVSP
jgi:hypothetical protein